MAFGYRRADSPVWWVRYKGVADPETGVRRNVAEACPPQVDSKEIADEYAEMRELQAKLEGRTPREAPSLAVRAIVASTHVTVMDAARKHPATQREIGEGIRTVRQHEQGVKEFTRVTGVKLLSELSMDAVMEYIRVLRIRGKTYWTRSHSIKWIKRAAAMAPSYGMIDPLGQIRLDRDTRPAGSEIQAYSLEEIATRLDAALGSDDPRIPAVIALGATCGLRPSELCRLRREDVNLVDATLQIATGKNSTSVRLLPIAPFVVEIIRPLFERKRIAPLITNGKAGERPIDIYKLSKLVGPVLGAPTKILRKTFCTVGALELGLDDRLVEAYMGHAISGFSGVTRKHYLARGRTVLLRPVAETFDRAFHDVAVEKNLLRLVTLGQKTA